MHLMTKDLKDFMILISVNNLSIMIDMTRDEEIGSQTLRSCSDHEKVIYHLESSIPSSTDFSLKGVKLLAHC